jgi:hypothetical protein
MSRWEDSTFDENPAVDQDEFAPVWEQLQEDLKEDARETIPELEEFIGDVLRARGIPVDDPVAVGGVEEELVVEWQNLRHAAARVRRGEDVTGEEIGVAIEAARDIWNNLQPTIAREDSSAMTGAAADEVELDGDAGDVGETRERLEEPGAPDGPQPEN